MELELPVVAQVQHERYLRDASAPPGWSGPVSIDTHGWWQPTPEAGRTLIVPRGTGCSDRDRWTIPGDGTWLQVGEQDYSHGPFGTRTPLLVHLAPTPESTMVDACTITEAQLEVFDRLGSVEQSTVGPQVYAGPCRVEVLGAQQARAGVAGEQQVTSRTLLVSVPWYVTAVPDHVVTVTASRDQRLIGRRLTVVGVDVETDILVRRIQAIDNLG